jgi:hypothetical protein
VLAARTIAPMHDERDDWQADWDAERQTKALAGLALVLAPVGFDPVVSAAPTPKVTARQYNATVAQWRRFTHAGGLFSAPHATRCYCPYSCAREKSLP